MQYHIAVVPGDGIGPEVVREALKVMNKIGERFDHSFEFETVLAGGAAIDKYGECLPASTLEACRAADAVLLGAVGGPKWDHVPGPQRPERALLGLRKGLGLYSNLRPAMIFEELASASPLKPELLTGGLDILIVRELTGGIYFGEHVTEDLDEETRAKHDYPADSAVHAYDVEKYADFEIERIARNAFEMARKRNGRVTSVDKANVLDTSRLWRKIVNEIAPEYPDVSLDHMYVDNAAMQLIRDPKHFDVIVTSNMFGDILSDEASQITGSIGLLPSSSLGDGTRGMYEPIHGSAPDIAGQNKANPTATVLSAAMMLRYSFGLQKEADCIERAVDEVLSAGWRTADILGGSESRALSCTEMTDKILERI